MRVLVVDDEEIVRMSVRDDLEEAGHQVDSAASAEEALQRTAEAEYEVVISDVRMPGGDGLYLLRSLREQHADTEVIMVSAYATVESAVEAMHQGAYDYVVKPFDVNKLLVILDRLAEHRALTEENRRLRAELQGRHGFHSLVGKSAAMQAVYRALDTVCYCDCTVLVCGATGTGKEMVADAIHYNSSRKDGPLVKVSCATLSRDVLESELFGHVRGAFTGALNDRKGRFEAAHRGTIFLDEVDDIPLDLQVKLLRVLESHEFERVGDQVPRRSDVRVVAATKVRLEDRVKEGRFRDDLFYRLNVVPVYLPQLTERREDIPDLIRSFCADSGRDPESFGEDVMGALFDHGWPGNVRELRNVVDRLTLTCGDRPIRVQDLPPEIRREAVDNGLNGPRSYDEIVGALERRLLTEALEKANGNKTRAAELLQMTPSTFRYRLSSLVGSEASSPARI